MHSKPCRTLLRGIFWKTRRIAETARYRCQGDPQLRPQSAAGTGEAAAGAAPQFRLPLDLPMREARDFFDGLYFNYHMRKEDGNMARVAQKAGLERTHLYRKLKQLGIRLPGKEPGNNPQ